MTRRQRWLALVMASMTAWCATATADVFRPAYLELRELGGDRYAVTWKVPAMGSERRLAAYVEFPEGTERLSEAGVMIDGGAWIERYRIEHPGGLSGKTVSITGSAAGMTEIIARVERLDGSAQVERLSLVNPAFVVQPPTGAGEVAASYLLLGIQHILEGADHLLFVLALLLVVRGPRRIVATITAFTLAHSITLVAATLGWVSVPGPPVEAVIALSIVFVASEVLHGLQGHEGLTARAPWVVAFSFGLLHGLGFAGALAEIGLPQVAIPLALLMFNVGVEIGQLIFVAAVLLPAMAAKRFVRSPPAWLIGATAYGIGGVASFWTVERIAGFWG